MNRQTNGACAVVDRPGHALADPPVGIRRKLVTHGRVEFVHGSFQADRSFLNQIQKFQTLVLIFLGNAHDQAEVGCHHPVARSLAHADAMSLPGSAILLSDIEQFLHGLHVVSQLDFFRCSEQWNSTNAAQVITD